MLSPDRTIQGGWPPLRSMLSCDASALEFLSDIASDGGSVLFVDGAEGFEDKAKLTVCDLIRAAAEIGAMSVVVTARLDFGEDDNDPSWLPKDAIKKLGKAPPLLIEDLTQNELDQLRESNSALDRLLEDSHPARDVIRNLFRLGRLLRKDPGDPILRTEAQMAEEWWRSADGLDNGRRERKRLLRVLASVVLRRSGPVCVGSELPTAIQGLIASGTLRELRTDWVTFRHDTLRDWAIGMLLYEEPALIEDLSLDQPASDTLIRGVEMTARLTAEFETDSSKWDVLVTRLSQSSIHGSWRRAAMLACVRSELSETLLKRLEGSLNANNGRWLTELIRLTIAVESEPGAKLLVGLGMDASLVPSDYRRPNNLSWIRLILWTFQSLETIPSAVIPDLVDLYSRWILAMLGQDDLTPIIVRQFYTWLIEVETALHPDRYADRRPPFGLSMTAAEELEERLRQFFLAFCVHAPEFADTYLRRVATDKAGNPIALSIVKSSGTAAEAAPQALADLTLRTLVDEREMNEMEALNMSPLKGPLLHDGEFLQPSPALGPFFELLLHSSKVGLDLIRRIVNHVIVYKSGGRDPGNDVVIIPFEDGERLFPWMRTEPAPWAETNS